MIYTNTHRLATCLLGCLLGLQSVFSFSTKVGERTISVEPITDDIIKVSNYGAGQATLPSRATVLGDAAESAAQEWYTPDGAFVIATPTGVMATLDLQGQLVISAGADKVVADNGLRKDIGDKQQFTLFTTAQGSFYGAGERGHSLNLRGDTLVMYNRQNYGYTKGDPRISQMNITMPLVVSSDGFAILFDDYATASLYLGDGADITYTTENPNAISYYYINGASSIADVVANLADLTGHQPLPPLWSLGYITSKYGYHNEKETLGAIDSLKRRGYPVDGIVLDLYWYGKEEDMGRLAWEPEQWPNPEKMLKKLKKENVNLVAISQPYVLRNGKAIDNYEYLAPRGMFVADSTGENPQEVVIWVGEGGMFDVSNPDTRQWLGQRYKELTDMGITGWWGDLGEPEVHPETGLHANGLTARQYHNQYGNDWSEIISELFKAEYPDTRLLTMMRGGTTGLQRYSVFPWSTDVSRSWGGLQPQVTIMLNSGLSGLGYMGHDVGGFAVDKENPEDAELYVRWLQLGTFSPMLRTHAQYKAEPYHYPQYAHITLPLIKERYRWLPYNYTLAYENAKYGYPLVRPLNFYETGNNAYDGIDDEYLWGSEVLVAPVMTQGATSRQVTFPQGVWIDYLNPAKTYEGGQTITYPAPLEVLPLFVKAGAFIPMANYDMKSTADYNPAVLTIDCFPVDGIDSQFSIYDDNRMSPTSLEDGEYRLINLHGSWDEEAYKIALDTDGAYAGAAQVISLTFVLHNIETSDIAVSACSAKIGKDKDGNVTVAIKYNVDTNPTITIQTIR